LSGDSGRTSRKAVLALAANAAGGAFGYAALLLIGRYFDPAAFGAYLFAIGLVGLLSLVANLGFGAAHQRHIAMGIPPDRALGVLVRIRIASNALFLVLVLAAYTGWAWLRGPGFTDATTAHILLAAVLLQLVGGARQILADTWAGQQRVNRVEGVRLLDTVLSLVVLANAALLLAHLNGRWTPLPGVGATWARLLDLDGPLGMASSGLLLAGSYLVGKTATLLLAVAWAATDRLRLARWEPDLARSYTRFALPVALTGALALVLQYTDTLMIGFFWTAREVGLYGAAQKLSVLASLLAVTVGTVLFPRFSQLHAAGHVQEEEATFVRAERYLLLAAAPIAAALVALPEQGLHIAVGDAYLDAALPLRLLGLTALVATMAQPMASRLMGTGHTGLLVRASALNAGCNVVLNLWLIPASGAGLGATGAALATLASSTLHLVYLRLQAHRLFGTPWVARVRILAAALAVGLGWAWAGHTLPAAWFDRVWELVAWGLLGVVLYGLLLLVLGEVTREDRAFLHRAAHPRTFLAEWLGR
jgi:O-antigen/teichoic acid export membrane protein